MRILKKANLFLMFMLLMSFGNCGIVHYHVSYDLDKCPKGSVNHLAVESEEYTIERVQKVEDEEKICGEHQIYKKQNKDGGVISYASWIEKGVKCKIVFKSYVIGMPKTSGRVARPQDIENAKAMFGDLPHQLFEKEKINVINIDNPQVKVLGLKKAKEFCR